MFANETEALLKCRDLLAMTENLGFILDAKHVKYLGDICGLDGAAVLLQMKLENASENARGQA